MNPLSEEDVARMLREHQVWSGGYCARCIGQKWPCDAYRLLEEREESEGVVDALIESGKSLGVEIAVLKARNLERVNDPRLESAPKAEAPMTAEDFVRDLEADIHMLTGRKAGRSPLITKAFIGAIRERDLSIAAAARKEAEEDRDQARRSLAVKDEQMRIDQESFGARSIRLTEDWQKAEHSRQALAEALRTYGEHDCRCAFNARGDCSCGFAVALATHGQEKASG